MIYDETWGIWLILILQDSGDWLRPIMELFTRAGYPQAYMIIVAIIYWSFDRKLGLRMAIFLPVTASLNSILKQAIHAPRPFWVYQSIVAIHPENGFGMPSGHAQSATVWLFAATSLKKSWFWILAVVMTFGVGISRPYLGVHFPSQVLLGWLLGIAVIVCFLRFESVVLNWISSLKIIKQLLFVFACTVIIFMVGAFFVLMLNNWDMPAEWARNANLYMALDKTGLKSYGIASVTGNAGSFLGVSMGAILMARKGAFDVMGKWWIRLLRVLLGLTSMILLYAGLQYIAPDKSLAGCYSTWRFFGFFSIAFLAVFLLPLVFIWLNLLKVKS